MTDRRIRERLTGVLNLSFVICHLSFVIGTELQARYNSPHAAKRARNSTTLTTPSRTSFARRFDPKAGTKTRVKFSTDSGSNHYRTLRRGTTLGPPEYSPA